MSKVVKESKRPGGRKGVVVGWWVEGAVAGEEGEKSSPQEKSKRVIGNTTKIPRFFSVTS